MALMIAIENVHVATGLPDMLFVQKSELWDSTATVNGVNITTRAASSFASVPNGTTVHRQPGT